jgi:phospholipid/cholesterol/gamma-HCH transport system ATP-binding protein
LDYHIDAVTNAPDHSGRINLLLPDEPRWEADTARPVIRLEGVMKRFEDEVVLKDINLDIHTGITTVICGQSGSGKSVLLRLMNGLMIPDAGRVLLFGEDTRKVSGKRLLSLRKRISMVFQNYALMDSLTVVENIAFPLHENTSMPWKDVVEKVQTLLSMLGLADSGNKLPGELSGGMKKRVSFARAVITNPEVVLFDEPTTGLDPIMIDFVDNLIEETQQRFGITSVIISHDMHSVVKLADRMAFLEDGGITEVGTVDEVRSSDNTQVEIFFEEAEAALKTGEKARAKETDDEVAVEDIIEVRDLHKSFGDEHVLRGVCLTIPRDQITVLIGGSGSGKSVLMKHLIGLMHPDKGTVRAFGMELSELKGKQLLSLRSRFGMLFQGAALLDGFTARQNIAFPLWERQVGKEELNERVDAILSQLQIQSIGDRYPSSMSVGERKRVGLARAIVTQPEVVIYDEPTTGQDPVMIRYVDDMIVEAQELFDITSIVVSHDMLSTFRIAHRVAMLHDGVIQALGSPDAVRHSSDPIVRRFIFAGTDAGRHAQQELASP